MWGIESAAAVFIIIPALIFLGVVVCDHCKQGIYDDKYVDMEPDKHTYDKAMESGDAPDVAKKK